MWVEKSYLYTCVTQSLVILLVRMWVEKLEVLNTDSVVLSSSMWGCELKSKWFRTFNVCIWLSSMWGCELKKRSSPRRSVKCRHPPCEDVSWKNGAVLRVAQVEESSSMWGCELKREWCKNVWYSSIALFMRKIVPSNDMNSIYVMRKRGELKEYKLQFLSIKKGLHY